MTLRLSILVVGVLLGCAPQPAPLRPTTAQSALANEIDELLADPVFANAHWGVVIQSVETGQVWYRRNARKLFMPASNMKIVTAAVALTRLGVDHRFRTTLMACGAVADGSLIGDLLVVGGGDPTISDRFFEGDAWGAFRVWADSLRHLGVNTITGRVVADDSFFDDVYVGPGWSWDYLDAAYAAEIGPLLLNEGAARFVLRPDSSGGVVVTVDPPTGYFTTQIDVTAVPDSTGLRLVATRHPFENTVELRGHIFVGADSVSRWVAAHDPTLFFVSNLTEALRVEGIAVASPATRRSEDCPDPTRLFVHHSEPLGEVLKPFLKESQNQIGEMLMRYVGAVATDTGSVATGRRVVEATLSSWGVPDDAYVYFDGSGLSRYNYLSPDAIVRILRAMTREATFDAFYESLPVAGVDGTLERRMVGTAAQGNARAKTGFISNARALSGYVTTADGERLAFSIIANNFTTSTRPVEYISDLIVERLANYSATRAGGGP